MHFAVNNNHKDLVALLLSWPGILPSIKDKEGRTAADRTYSLASSPTPKAAPPQRQPLQSLHKLNIWDAAERGEVHWLYAKLKPRLESLRAAEHLEANPPPKLKPWEERERKAEEARAAAKQSQKELKRRGSAMELQIDSAGLWGRTALHYCAIAGHALCAHLLLRCKAECVLDSASSSFAVRCRTVIDLSLYVLSL